MEEAVDQAMDLETMEEAEEEPAMGQEALAVMTAPLVMPKVNAHPRSSSRSLWAL